jgi:hypothetical protein
MALHTDLPIHKTGCALLELAFKVQAQMPRASKRHLGEKILGHCMQILDLMAMANMSKGAHRAEYITHLLTHVRAAEVLLRIGMNSRQISTNLWAQCVELLESIGKQGGGWLKSSQRTAPAA